MPDFWRSSGYHLLRRDAHGRLAVTADYLRAYLTRPEIHPVADSCPAEHALFARLMESPLTPVAEGELATLADADARDNYRVLLAFRDRLSAEATLEAAYFALATGGAQGMPPLFLDQMAHVLLRNILAEARDPLRLRAAELFFREQTANVQDGRIMLADAETVALQGDGRAPLLPGLPRAEVALDVLDEENKEEYWARSDRFDTAIDLRFTEPPLDALARVIEAWIRHFTGVSVRIQPAPSIRDERWSWHIGLDAEASRILDALYREETVGEDDLSRILALFRMDILEPRRVLPAMRGKPVYLGLAMTPGNRVRMKPQNLLANLPFQKVS